MMKRELISIPTPQPFSLAATVLSHGWHECSPMSWSEGGQCFQFVERHAGAPCRISVIQPSHRGALRPRLDLLIEAAEVSEELLASATTQMRWILALDEDLDEFYALCAVHPVLAVLPRMGAGRSLRSWSMCENILKALLATNVNWSQAVKMINRLGQLGPSVPNFANLNAWPSPREILRAGESYLRDVCRAGYRTEAVQAFCRDVCEGAIDPECFRDRAADPAVTSDVLLAELRSIRGIGPSSAHYLLGFLGRHDRMSIDSATVAFVARAHNHGRKPTIREIERLYEPYGRWKNKVWWFEHWLTWGTARRLLADSSEPAAVPGRKRPAGGQRR